MRQLVINERLTELEREFAEGWARGTLKKYGLTKEEIDRIIEAKKDMLVETAKEWKQGLLRVFAPEIAKRKLTEVVE